LTRSANSNCLRTALLCLWATGLAGCSDFVDIPTWVPFQGPVTDKLPGVVTPAQRIACLHKLAKESYTRTPLEKQRVVDDLTTSIRSESDAMIRAEIIRTLGLYPGEKADTVLKAALHDPDADVRVAACEAWGKRPGHEAAASLIGVLGGDLDTEVRLAAAKALGKTKDRTALAVLGNTLEDSDPAMQYQAVLALREITGKDLGNDVNQWRQYVKGEPPKPAAPVSLTERLQHMF
jgi:HEAT repeat protein